MTPHFPAAKTAISILNWNGADLTESCIQSLLDTGSLELADVYILDNGSNVDETTQLQRYIERHIDDSLHSKITILRSEDNRGFAGGHNYLISQILESGIQYTNVLLLNQDTVSLTEIVAPLAKELNDGVAAVGALVVERDKQTIQSFGGSLHLLTGKVSSNMQGMTLSDVELQTADTNIVLGNCMLISLAAWKEIGGFNETFFAYYEEVDWCIRAQRAGWKLHITPDAKISHLKSGGFRTYWIFRNMIIFQRRHASFVQLLLFGLYHITWFTLERIKKGSRISEIIRGIYSGWTTKLT